MKQVDGEEEISLQKTNLATKRKLREKMKAVVEVWTAFPLLSPECMAYHISTVWLHISGMAYNSGLATYKQTALLAYWFVSRAHI